MLTTLMPSTYYQQRGAQERGARAEWEEQSHSYKIHSSLVLCSLRQMRAPCYHTHWWQESTYMGRACWHCWAASQKSLEKTGTAAPAKGGKATAPGASWGEECRAHRVNDVCCPIRHCPGQSGTVVWTQRSEPTSRPTHVPQAQVSAVDCW